MTCRRTVYFLDCEGQRSRSQGHKIEKPEVAFSLPFFIGNPTGRSVKINSDLERFINGIICRNVQ